MASRPRPAARTAVGPGSTGRRIRAYIGLGANLGEAEDTLVGAVQALGALPDASLVAVSRLYVTTPVGVADQPDFLNAVVALDVPAGSDPAAGALALLVELKALEREFGRKAGRRWGPRTLDLDILTFGDARLSIERPPEGQSIDKAHAARLLEVPHAAAADRLFVLAPLAELAPDLVPPGWTETITEARDRRRSVEGPGAVRPLSRWSIATARWAEPAPGYGDANGLPDRIADDPGPGIEAGGEPDRLHGRWPGGPGGPTPDGVDDDLDGASPPEGSARHDRPGGAASSGTDGRAAFDGHAAPDGRETLDGSAVAPDGSPVAIYADLPGDEEAALIHRALVSAGLLERCRILELGCGAGRITAALAELGHPVIAVDQSEAMLAEVRRRAPTATVVAGDIETLALGRRVPAVLLGSHLVNAEPGLRSAFLDTCRRHVSAGGCVLVQAYDPDRDWSDSVGRPTRAGPVTITVLRADRDGDRLAASIAYETQGHRLVQDFAAELLDEDGLREALDAAGLRFERWFVQRHGWLIARPA